MEELPLEARLGIYWEFFNPEFPHMKEATLKILSLRPRDFAKEAEVLEVYDDGGVLVKWREYYVEFFVRPAAIRVSKTLELTREYYVARTRRASRFRRAILKEYLKNKKEKV